ncbi:unnamed protein product, partial [Mesorhabditis belari]|uniref:C-type lectin domain-containing protein n=1 Tax=Mesorhabditis belari TaxID=2138241 RepID=A0AAF3ELQ6_9BILA
MTEYLGSARLKESPARPTSLEEIWEAPVYKQPPLPSRDFSAELEQISRQRASKLSIAVILLSAFSFGATIYIVFLIGYSMDLYDSVVEIKMKLVEVENGRSPTPPCGWDDGWFHARNLKNCYKVIFNVTLEQAINQCRAFNANVTSIHSDEENRVVNNLLKLNLTCPGPILGGLIGAKRTGGGVNDWMWIDGSVWDYTRWDAGEPNNFNAEEGCLQTENLLSCWQFDDTIQTVQNLPSWFPMKLKGMDKWNDISCGRTFNGAICKKTAHF